MIRIILLLLFLAALIYAIKHYWEAKKFFIESHNLFSSPEKKELIDRTFPSATEQQKIFLIGLADIEMKYKLLDDIEDMDKPFDYGQEILDTYELVNAKPKV